MYRVFINDIPKDFHDLIQVENYLLHNLPKDFVVTGGLDSILETFKISGVCAELVKSADLYSTSMLVIIFDWVDVEAFCMELRHALGTIQYANENKLYNAILSNVKRTIVLNKILNV